MTSELPNVPSPHVHPESLDSGSTPEAFVAREVELGTGAATATDHGSMAAVRTVYDLARKANLTPILGFEGYLRDDDCPILLDAGYRRDEDGTFLSTYKYGHFCLHLEDQAAYERASVVLSRADLRAEQHGSERKPIMGWRDLEELGETNVTLTSGCLIGAVARHLVERADARTAVRYYERMRALVRPGAFYVEVFPHDTSKNYVNALFLDLEGGERIRFRAAKDRDKGKLIRVSGQEIRADQLVGRKELGELQGIKNYHTWEEREPRRILRAELVEGFIENECKPWAGGNPDVQAAVNRFMIAMARRYGDPVLISDDAHYANPEDKIVQDTRLAQSGNWRMYGSYHRYSSEEARAHFQRTLGTSDAEFQGWLENNQAWAARFKGFKFDTPVSLPTKFYPADTLGHLMGLIKAGGRMRWGDRRYLERLATEIDLLHRNGVEDMLPYFFTSEEAVGEYRRAGIITGPGRGSAAGLLIAFLLHITHVDPLHPSYQLSLDRFLTKDRIKDGAWPDIDMDFPHRELLEGPEGHPEQGWLRRRFGDHFAQISTNMTLRARAAVKDVCRMTQGVVSPEVEDLTKQFSKVPQGVTDRNHIFGYTSDDGKEVPGAVTYDVALQQFVAQYHREWEIVQKCLSLARGKSRHASAYAIMNEPVQRRLPTMTIGGVLTTQFTAGSVEKMGAIKMDFLVVRALLAIQDAVQLVQRRSGVMIPSEGQILENRGLVPSYQLVPHGDQLYDVWDLPDDDVVFKEIAAGKTETVFQFNTEGVRGWLKYFDGPRPDGRPALSSVYDLAVLTALDRPGPLDALVPDPAAPGEHHNMLVEYAHRTRGMARSTGILPVMDKLLPSTHGVMVFQEQVQYAYQQLTGCTGSEAEEFRRNVSKKKAAKIQEAFKFFFPRASERMGEENARQIWDAFNKFAAYGFNLSHAVCYALIGYVCAFLKYHHPQEWWCAVMRHAKKDDATGKHWAFVKHMIDLPDLTRAAENFELHGDRIVAPLTMLHGLGETAHAQLLAAAPYASVEDLVAKVEAHKRATGKTVRKIRKNKKTKLDEEVEVFQNGHSAVHRGIIYPMLIVGTMDALLPEDVRKGTVLEKLFYFEQASARVTGAKRPKPVPEWYGKIGALARYVLRKKILPAYAEDVRPIVAETLRSDFTVEEIRGKPAYRWRGIRVRSGREIRFLDTVRPLPPGGLREAALAYVQDTRAFTYHESKRALELVLDIDGETIKMVAWPSRSKKQAISPGVKGHLVLVELTRWKDQSGFAVGDLEIVQAPVTAGEGDTDGNGGSEGVAGADRGAEGAGDEGPGGRAAGPEAGMGDGEAAGG